MHCKRIFIIFLLVSLPALPAFVLPSKEETRDDLKKFYDAQGVEGSFVLYDEERDTYLFCNKADADRPYSPSSTFKILNSMIGLETGVIPDESFVIPWDSVVRQNPKWNTDHDLKTAYRNSTVWYYRELARRVGGAQMKHWLDRTGYGNADTSGGIDLFWLKGGLRVTPRQQIGFLRKLRQNQLPFSARTTAIVKNIMIAKDTSGYTLRAKSGWADDESKSTGWYIGYLESNGKVYYFCNCIHTSDFNKARARITIAEQILSELGLTPR